MAPVPPLTARGPGQGIARRLCRLRVYVAADDAGRLINPLIVEGQSTARSPKA